MTSDDQSKFMADQVSGVSAILLAVVRTLEESGALNREDLVDVINEFRSDMKPDELDSGEGFMIDRFLDVLKDEKLTRFEFD